MDNQTRGKEHQRSAATTEAQRPLLLSSQRADDTTSSSQSNTLPSMENAMYFRDFEGLQPDCDVSSTTTPDPTVSLFENQGQYISFMEANSSGAPTVSSNCSNYEDCYENMTYRTRSTPHTSDTDQNFSDRVIDDDIGLDTAHGSDYSRQDIGQGMRAQAELLVGHCGTWGSADTHIDPSLLQQVPRQQVGSSTTTASIPLRGPKFGSLRLPPWSPETINQDQYNRTLPAGEAIYFEPAGTTPWNQPVRASVGHKTFWPLAFSLEPQTFGPPRPPHFEPPEWQHRVPLASVPNHQCGLDASMEYYPEDPETLSDSTVKAGEATASESKRKGGRTKPLSADSRKKAHNIRKRRACWRCRFLRNSCSDHDVCKTCRNTRFQIYRMPCDRSRLSDRIELILPDVIVGEYAADRLIAFCNEHVAQWSNNFVSFQLTFGCGPPIGFKGVELIPRGAELLSGLQHVTDDDSQLSRLIVKVSPPIGLIAQSSDHFQLKFGQYLDSFIVSHWLNQWPGSCFEGKTEVFQREILSLVCQYCMTWTGNAKWHELLRKTLKLQILGYIMGRTLTIPNEDDPNRRIIGRETVRRRLQNPGGTSYPPDTSPRMANKQVKSLMCALYRKMFVKVLAELEEMILYRDGDTWGPSFCVMILLAMIFADTQISIDIAVQCENTRGRHSMDRAWAMERCRDIEDKAFNSFIEIFHSRYKTRNQRKQGFNPLRNGSSEYTDRLDSRTAKLVDEVNSLKHEYGRYPLAGLKST
ncbi:MAG: hypothetical protein M1812_000582 [Candelaria pacifica]|nr:MAG: hypothetical protein M1812_000582 [Candelaria pacifica]